MHWGSGRVRARLLFVVAVAIGAIVLTAAPAFAHASLLQSDPAPGAVLQQSPKQITLSFNETVSVAFGAIRVYDSDANLVDKGGAVRSNVVSLPVSKLDDGSYVVTWRVTSADSHPVAGAFAFQVGNAANATGPAVQALTQRLLNEQGGDRVVGVLYGITRWMLFAGIALLFGATAFGVVVWAPARVERRTRRLALTGWGMTFVSTVGALLLYGPYAASVGLGDVFNSTLLNDTLGARLGQTGVARLGVLVIALPVLYMLFRGRGDDAQPVPRVWLLSAAVIAVGVAVTPGLSGHAATGDYPTAAVVADTIHVLAMGIWLGGLGALAFVLLPRSPIEVLHDAVPRWSRIAMVCVVAIVVTGGFQTWRQVGNLTALRSTDYGRMLIVKLLLFAGMIVLAAFSREIVLRLFPPPPEIARRRGLPVVAGGSDDHRADEEPELTVAEWDAYEAFELRRMRRSVWAEVVVGVAILVVTALLVNAPPAKSAVAQGLTGAIGLDLKTGSIRVDITAAPGKKGVNDIHLSTLTIDGRPKQVQDLTMTISMPGKKIAPIKVPLGFLSDGHYVTSGFTVPIAGTWKVVVKVVVSQFKELTVRGELDFT